MKILQHASSLVRVHIDVDSVEIDGVGTSSTLIVNYVRVRSGVRLKKLQTRTGRLHRFYLVVLP